MRLSFGLCNNNCMDYTIKSKLWMFGGEGSWYFANLPIDVSEEIRSLTAQSKNIFGSVKVIANINKSTWQTSLFPDSKSGCYVLPIKKTIRESENLTVDHTISLKIKLI